MLSSNSTKVVCQDGSFQPQNVCDLIPYKVTECENTNLKNCPYVPKELADYWRRKEPLGPDDAEGVDFDLFPDIEGSTKWMRASNVVLFNAPLRYILDNAW
uniref:uncharacterized protein LOC120336839 isoform X2 n=1 Tax=Styela clava TaxID=7725 RepID=UPI00193A7BDD|nr:uncharacterized protein LOC120336839 isoform X2 [Styela clava]